MIVFYGANRLFVAGQRKEANVRFGSELTGEQTKVVDQWIRRPTLNLTDLRHFSLPVLCHLYEEFLANHTNSTWEWDLEEVSIKDVVGALHLDGYFSPENVVELPLWFKIIMVICMLICILFTCFKSCRTLFAIATQRCSPISVLIGTLAANDTLIVGCTAIVEITSTVQGIDVWIPNNSSWWDSHLLATSFQYRSAQNYGPIGCYFVPFLQSSSALVSAIVLSLIICDRYTFVFGMEASANGQRPLITGWRVAVACVFSIGLAMPTFWLWSVYHFIIVDDTPDPDYGIDFCSAFPLCLTDSKWSTGRRSFFFIYQLALCAATYGPLLLLFLVTFYRRTGRYLRIGHVVQGIECRPIKFKKMVSRSLLGLVAAFFICKLPASLYFLLGLSPAIEATPAGVFINKCLQLLYTLNTCINPSFYMQLDQQTSHSVAKCLRSNSVGVGQQECATKSRDLRRNKNETFDLGSNTM